MKQQQRDRAVLLAALALGSLSVLGAALTIHHYRDRRRLMLEGPRRIPKKPHKVNWARVWCVDDGDRQCVGCCCWVGWGGWPTPPKTCARSIVTSAAASAPLDPVPPTPYLQHPRCASGASRGRTGARTPRRSSTRPSRCVRA